MCSALHARLVACLGKRKNSVCLYQHFCIVYTVKTPKQLLLICDGIITFPQTGIPRLELLLWCNRTYTQMTNTWMSVNSNRWTHIQNVFPTMSLAPVDVRLMIIQREKAQGSLHCWASRAGERALGQSVSHEGDWLYRPVLKWGPCLWRSWLITVHRKSRYLDYMIDETNMQ